MRVFDVGGAVVRVDGNGWLGGGEQSAALDQFLSADAIGEEAEVANADQSGGQHVEQEAADEFDRIEGHGLGAGVIRVVFPIEADTAVFQRAKSVVGDGDAVARKIVFTEIGWVWSGPGNSQSVGRLVRQYQRSSSRSFGGSSACRSFRPLPERTHSTLRALSMSATLSRATSLTLRPDP